MAAKHNIRILFIADNGLNLHNRYVFRVYQQLKRSGFDVELLRAPHIPIKNFKSLSFAFFSTLKAIFNRRRYDIVHAFNPPSAFAMRCTRAGIKVLSMHGVYSNQIDIIHSGVTSFVVRMVERRILQWADRLATDSRDVATTYKKKTDLDFALLLGPIDIEKLERIKIPAVVKNQVVYIGRDSREKGVDVLRSIESRIDADVVYCTNIRWEHAMYLLRQSRILVLPSRAESLPNVAKEAFYFGKPVVASDVGGIPEIVIHEKTGILVPPDDPESLLRAINDLLKDTERAQDLGMAGHKFLMENYTWDVLLPKYVEFYEGMVR